MEDLKKQLHKENVKFYSVIVFYGDCVFKDVDFLSNGTFLIKANRILQVMKIIQNSNQPASYTDKREVVRILGVAVKNGDKQEIQRDHIENIKNMLSENRIFN